MDLIGGFKQAVRAILGLPIDPGQPPDLMRLGLYPARVDVCASDGSTCDVTPDDKRISPQKNVPVRVGIPGAVSVVAPGAVVLLGWERGDPAKPYVTPAWTAGATVNELVLNATMAYIGAKGGANFIALANKVQNYLTALSSAINGWTPVPNDGGAALKAALSSAGIIGGTWGTDCAATKAKAI